ncbi:MAG: tetratricopeptide repeat protein [Janthinobacterium lividum]
MKKNKFMVFLKKYFYLFFFVFLFSLSICTIVVGRNYKLKTNDKNIEEFKEIADNLQKKKVDLIFNKQDYLKKNENIYSVLIGINLSKQFFLKKEYTQAINVLKKILLITQEENLIFYIKLNLVKIYIKKKDFSSALDIIRTVNNSEWNELFQQYKKFILLKKRSQ